MFDFLTNHPKFSHINNKTKFYFEEQCVLELHTDGFRAFYYNGPFDAVRNAPEWFVKLYIDSTRKLWELDKMKNLLNQKRITEKKDAIALTSLLISLENGEKEKHRNFCYQFPNVDGIDKNYLEKVNQHLHEYFELGIKDFERVKIIG